MSVPPAGAKPTINRTGRLGYDCACAMPATVGRAAAPAGSPDGGLGARDVVSHIGLEIHRLDLGDLVDRRLGLSVEPLHRGGTERRAREHGQSYCDQSTHDVPPVASARTIERAGALR